MSGVVLRCPNCGTTSAAPGECQACHEAQARYYCTAHTPGRWLDTPSCPQCGARFGEPSIAPARPVPAPPPRAPARPSPTAPGPKPTPAPRVAPRAAPAGRPVSGMDAGRRRERLPPAEYEEVDVRDAYTSRGIGWRELLRYAARARRVPPDAVFDREAAPPVRSRLGGCLGRLVLIVLLLLLTLVGGVSMLGGSLLRLFLPY